MTEIIFVETRKIGQSDFIDEVLVMKNKNEFKGISALKAEIIEYIYKRNSCEGVDDPCLVGNMYVGTDWVISFWEVAYHCG